MTRNSASFRAAALRIVGLWLLLAGAPGAGIAQQNAPAEDPPFPSPEWTARELQNFARVGEAPLEQLQQPAFLQRWQTQSVANVASFAERAANDPSWLLATSQPLADLLGSLSDPASVLGGVEAFIQQLSSAPLETGAVPLNLPLLPLCATWAEQCTGDPFRYPGVDPFFEEEAEVEPVVFHDRECARLSGRVWKPRAAEGPLPGVVIMNGSIQAPEPIYWWAAQALVRAGYMVMTLDPRGQGRSDFQTPSGGQGSDLNPSIFWDGLVDAVDFFRSSPSEPYPHNISCAGIYPTETAGFNPFHEALDLERLGLAGHSSGAIAASVVQSYDAPETGPWPGQIDATNPVDAIVAWDGLLGFTTQQLGGSLGAPFDTLPPALTDPATRLAFFRDAPRVTPRVPAMGQSSDYGVAPAPFVAPPDPEQHKLAFADWQSAGVPAFELTVAGSTHYEWSLLPTFPTTSWCPEIVDGRCQGGWGLPMVEHYTVAWFDRWLKQPGEAGFETADARLLDDARFAERFSFYYRSARDFPTRSGSEARCEDIRAGCDTREGTAPAGSGGGGASGSGGSGGAWAPWGLLLAGVLAGARLRRRRSDRA